MRCCSSCHDYAVLQQLSRAHHMVGSDSAIIMIGQAGLTADNCCSTALF